MNISKRLLTVLMCVAMVVSILSSFGYALGGATGSTVTDAIDESVAVKGEPLSGTALSNGANPTTNVAAPTIDSTTTLVYDPAATEASTGNYNLAEHFTDMSTGAAVPGSENWVAAYGINLFSDWWTMLAAKPDNATILVVNSVTSLYSLRDDATAHSTPLTTRGISIYSPYFNVMPYTTGTALDGSDWAANPNWAGPSVSWPGNNFEGGEWNIYGFKFNNYFNTTKADLADPMQLSIVNSAWDVKGAGTYGVLYVANDAQHTALNTTGSKLVMKNVHFFSSNGSVGRILWGPMANVALFDGCFFDNFTSTSGNNYWCKAPSGGPAQQSFTMTNCNFQNNATHNWIWQNASTTKISFTKNIFNNSQLSHDNGKNGAPNDGIFGSIYTCGDFEVMNNRLFSTDKNRPLFKAYSTVSVKMTVTGNYLGAGVEPEFDFITAKITAKDGSVCKLNYSVTGKSVAPNKITGFSSDSFIDYIDADMTRTVEALYPTAANADKGTLNVNMATRTLSWFINDGILDLSKLHITLADGTTGSWETTPTDFGTHKFNITDGTNTISFTVEISKPENLFTDNFVSDGIITKDAILLDSGSEATAPGMIYTATWKGQTLNFIKGQNVFSTVKEYEAWAKATGTSGHQVICLTKPIRGIASSQTNHFYPEVPAKYYTPLYDVPVNIDNPDGTKSLNSAGWASKWTYDGFGFPSRTRYGTYEPQPGEYEFHGFANNQWEMWYIAVGGLKLKFENCYITIAGTKVETNPEGASTAALFDTDDGALVFENCYMNRTGGSRWITNAVPALFALRNNFWDDTSGQTTNQDGTPYIKQYTKNATVDISGNYFKNYHGFWYFEGNNRKDGKSYAEASEREFIFNNNVFDNSELFSGYGLVNATPDGYNKITAVGNKSYNRTETTPLAVIAFSDYSSASNTGPNEVPLEIKIEDNYIIDGKDITIRSGRIMAEDSKLSIKNNYVTRDGKAVGMYEANGKVPASPYYIDAAMTTLSTALLVESLEAADGGTVTFDNKTYEIYFNLATSDSTLDDLIVNVPDGTTVTFHTDAACESEAIEDLTNIDGGKKVYMKSAVAAGSIIYSVTLVAAEKYLFEENFVDSSDFGIDATNAYLITDEVASLPNGAFVNLEWKGEAFDFEVGRTVFANQKAFHQYVVDNEIENPDVLVKTMKENLVVNYPSRWFGQNYDVNPIYKENETVEDGLATGAIGEDWAFNEGEWNEEYDEGFLVGLQNEPDSSKSKRYFDNIIIGRTDALGNSEAVPGDYLFAGFRVSYALINDSTTANVELWNTYFNTNNLHDNVMFPWAGSNTETVNKFTNIYVRPNYDGDSTGTLFGGTFGKELVVDNMFVDIKPVTYTGKGNSMLRVGPNGTVTIKNSFFRNFTPKNQAIAGNGDAAITEGVTSTLILENNILINSQFQAQYNGAFSFKPDTLTNVVIAGNYIDNRDKNAWGGGSAYAGSQLVGTNGGSNSTPTPLVAEVYDNYLIGIHSNTGTWGGRLYDEENSYFTNNFATKDITPDKDIYDMEGTYFQYYTDDKVTVIPVLDWKITANGEKLASQLVEGTTFDGSDVSDGEVIDYGVELTTETINLRDLFVSEGNYIDVYSDASCAPEYDLSMSKLVVPANGGTFYVKVSPIVTSVNPDADCDDPIIITLNITKDAGFAIKTEGLGVNGIAKDGEEKDAYWLSWRGSVFIAGETVEGDSGHRAGIVYFSSLTNYDAYIEAITTAVAGFTAADDIDAALESINAEIRATDTSIIGYAIDKNKTLVWDSVTQSYGYRYNFAVEEGNIRGGICYVVYFNEETDAYEVMFSEDFVVQQVPAPTPAE